MKSYLQVQWISKDVSKQIIQFSIKGHISDGGSGNWCNHWYWRANLNIIWHFCMVTIDKLFQKKHFKSGSFSKTLMLGLVLHSTGSGWSRGSTGGEKYKRQSKERILSSCQVAM